MTIKLLVIRISVPPTEFRTAEGIRQLALRYKPSGYSGLLRERYSGCDFATPRCLGLRWIANSRTNSPSSGSLREIQGVMRLRRLPSELAAVRLP